MSMPIDISEEAGVRYLHFGSDWIQGAMRISRPWALELDYTREMMAALLLRPEAEWPRQALLIGLGAASLTKFLYRHRPQAKLSVVEIEPEVVAAARQYFKLPEDPRRLRIEIADGAEWLAGSDEMFDLILVDGFDAEARAGALDTLPFYRACRAHLDDAGLLAVNLLGRNRGFKASVERIRKAFDDRAMVFPSCDHGNAIAFAATGEAVSVPLGELGLRAIALRKATGLNLLPTVARLVQWQSCPGSILKL
ncbi:MAG: spermidine synthase [Rhodocyclaceae bacterium UTPRO2]|jgi:spermidine synthase|nr:MAG: spermidine synthase [Rhodocyclaceae bacterium UTPRO2]